MQGSHVDFCNELYRQQFPMRFCFGWLQIMAARLDGINDDSGDPSQPQLPVMDAQI